MQYERVAGLLEDCRHRGARILAGGELPSGPGYFFPPTLVAGLPEDAPAVREEQFGPLLPIMKFTDIEDAIARANDTRYGLAASIWSADAEGAAQLAARLEAGTVWINCYDVFDAAAPFGGYKRSGIGRELGEKALDNYTELKTVTVSLG